MPDFPENRSKFDSPEIPEPHYSKKEQVSGPLFQRMLQAFKELLPEQAKGVERRVEILGKIRDVTKEGKQICRELEDKKEAFLLLEDPEFPLFAESIINPLLSEEKRMQSHFRESALVADRVKFLNRYLNWMQQARGVLDFLDQMESEDEILPKVIEHVVSHSQAHIDRDLQVIEEYHFQRMKGVRLTDEQGETVQMRIVDELECHRKKLEDLKESPELDTVQEVSHWKQEVDRSRTRLVNEALELVDQIFEDEMDFLIRVPEDQSTPRERLNGLKSQYKKLKKRPIPEDLKVLKDALREMHVDLRLPEELVEEVEALLKKLKDF